MIDVVFPNLCSLLLSPMFLRSRTYVDEAANLCSLQTDVLEALVLHIVVLSNDIITVVKLVSDVRCGIDDLVGRMRLIDFGMFPVTLVDLLLKALFFCFYISPFYTI